MGNPLRWRSIALLPVLVAALQQAQATAEDSVGTPEAAESPLPPGASIRLGSTRLRHAGTVVCSTFSPDGKGLFTAGSEGQICHSIAPNWRNARSINRGSEVRECRLAVSPEGTKLAASVTGGIEIYGLPDLKFEKVVETTPFANVGTLAFSGDGKALICGDVKQRVLQVWSLETGNKLHEVRSTGLSAVSGSGDKVAFQDSAGSITVRSISNWLVSQSISTGPGRLCGLALSADGNRLALCFQPIAEDGKIEILQIQPEEKLYALDWTPTRFGSTVDSLCFSPDGDLLAAGDGDRTLVWRGRQYDVVATLSGRPASFSSDSKLLACRRGKAAQLWDTTTWQAVVEGHADTPRPLAFLSDGTSLVSCDASTVCTWDIGTQMPTCRSTTKSIEFCTPRGNLISNDGNRIEIRNFPHGNLSTSWECSGGSNLSLIGHSADYSRILGLLGSEVYCFECPSLRNCARLDIGSGYSTEGQADPRGYLVDAATHPLLPYLAISRSDSPGIAVWDLRSSRRMFSLAIEQRYCESFAFSTDGFYLASATKGINGTESIVLYETATGEKLGEFPNPGAGICVVHATSDPRLICSARASRDGWSIRYWDIATGRIAAHLEHIPSGSGPPLISADGKRVAAGGADTCIYVYEPVATLTPLPPTDPADLPIIWDELVTDGPTLYSSLWRLIAAGDATVSWLDGKLDADLCSASIDRERTFALATQLGSATLEQREQAWLSLSSLGPQCKPILEEIVRNSLNDRAKLEAGELLNVIDGAKVAQPDVKRRIRALHVLAMIGSPAASRQIAKLAGRKADCLESRIASALAKRQQVGGAD